MIKQLKRSEKAALLLIGLSAIGVAVAGYIFARQQNELIRASAANSLVAVSDMKVSQLATWRKERLSDARFLMTAPAVARDVRSYFENSEDLGKQQGVLQWMSVMKGGARYKRVVLFDKTGQVRLSVPAQGQETDPLVKAGMELAKKEGQLQIIDLHRNKDGVLVMEIVVPVLGVVPDRGEQDAASGVVMLELDPAEYLFPLITTWPLASETAESILCRLDSGAMVYMNELRYDSTPALQQRMPVPAQLAQLTGASKSVVATQIDYRGQQVVSAMRWIPDSPWFLMSKIDAEEVQVPLRRLAYGVLSVVGVLVSSGVALFIWVLGRARTAGLLRELEAERTLKALAQRLALVTQHANEIILIADEKGAVVEANEVAVSTYGYNAAELKGLKIEDLREEKERLRLGSQMDQVWAQGSSVYETVHVTREGRSFPVEVSCRVVELEGRRAMLAIVRDETQRKRHEAEILRLNHLYEALTQINQMLVRVSDLDTLLSESCRIMVQYGHFWMVWIGRYDEVEELVFPVASDGEELDFLDGFSLSTRGKGENPPPTLVAVKQGRSEVCRDFSTIAVGPWKERLAQYRFKSSAAFPIRHRHRVWGNLTVYSVDPMAFGQSECDLMEETAADISYAMDVMADRQEHRKMEMQLRESEVKFRTLFETMTEIVALHELVHDASGRPVDYRIIDCNTSYSSLLGIPRERAIGSLASKLYGTGQAPYLHEFARVAVSGQPYTFESYFEPMKRHFSISVASPGTGRFATVATDITVRKHTESSLKESENRFRATFEHAAAGIAHVSIDGHFLRVNQRLCELLGHTREELLRSTFQEVTHPEDLSADLSQIRRLLGGEIETYSMEKRYIAHNGGVVWAQLTVSLVEHPEGVPHYLIAVIQDIGLRKQAEAALRGSEERYRRLTRAVTDYVYTVRLENGQVAETIHGEGCIAVTGYSPREFLHNQHLWIEMVVPEDRELVNAQAKQILKNHGSGAVEHRIRVKDGHIRWVRNTTSPHFDSRGKFLSYDGLVQDITERKVAEIQLRETNDELQATNHTIAVCGSSIDLDSVVHTIIDQALRLTRLEGATLCLLNEDNTLHLIAQRNTSEEAIHALSTSAVKVGKCLCGNCAADCKPLILSSPEQVAVYATQDYHHSDPLSFHAAYPLLAQKRCLGVLCLFARGHEKPNPSSLRVVESLCNSFALAIQNALLHRETVRYATQMESLVRGRTQELENANAELESFSYSVSHDLRAPLRAVNGVLQILVEDYGATMEEEVRGHIETACSQSRKMGFLIDDLLAFSRLGRQALHKTEIDLGVLFSEVQAELMGRESGRVVEWRINPFPSVYGDPVFLRQVFINLVGNALKYTRKREKVLIEVGGSVDGDEAVICVRDNGAGFDMKYADKLFGVFQRLHSDGEFEGTGVGLALVQRIVLRHGGRVWAEGKVDEGAAFYFTMPIAPREQDLQEGL